MSSDKYNIDISVTSTGVGEFTKLGQKTKELNDALALVAKVEAFDGVVRDAKESGKAFVDAKRDARRLADELGASKEATQALRTEHGKAKQAVDGLSGATKEEKKALKAAKEEVKRLSTELKASEKNTRSLSKEHKQAETRVDRLGAANKKSREALKGVSQELQKAGVNTRKLSTEQTRLTGVVDSLKASQKSYKREVAEGAKLEQARLMLGVRPHREIRREIDLHTAAYNRLKRSGTLTTAELWKANQQLKKKTQELKAETNGWAASLGKAKVGIMGVVGVGYGMAKSFSSYATYAQKMAEVNTLLDVSKERHAALSDEISEMSTRIPQSAESLAAAEYDILSAGVALEESTKVLELSAKAAVGGVTDTQTAVNAGVGVLNAYGLSVDKLEGVYDTLFMTVKKGVTTFPELSQHMGDVLPSARAANVGFTEVSAAIASMTKSGLKTPQAATALKGAINAMAAPAPEAKKKFDELGITWQGLIPTLEQIAEKNLSVDQMRLLIPDVEARTGVLAMTQNIDDLKGTLGEMEHASGSAREAFNKMKDTPHNEMVIFRNELTKLNQELGEFASVFILPAVKGLRFLINGMREADGPTKVLISTFGAAAAGLVIWKAGIQPVANGLQGLVNGGTALTKVFVGAEKATKLVTMGLKGGLAVACIYVAIQVARAVHAFIAWKKAEHDAAEAHKKLIETTEKVKDKYKEFADVKVPENLTKVARDDLEVLRRDLQKSKAYWVAMYEASRGDEAKEKEVQEKLDRIGEALNKVRGIQAEYAKESKAQATESYDAAEALAEKLKEVHRVRLSTYKEEKEELKLLNEEQLADLELAEAEGTVAKAEATAQRLRIERKFLDDSLVLAKEHRQHIEEVFEGTEEERRKALEESSGEIRNLEIELKKSRAREIQGLTETQKEEEAKRVKAAEEAAAAIVKLSTDEAAARSTALAAYTAKLELEEARGIITHEECIEKKRDAEIKFAKWRVDAAEAVAEELAASGQSDTDEYKKAVEDKKQAQIELIKLETEAEKAAIESADKQAKAQEQVKESVEETYKAVQVYVSTFDKAGGTIGELLAQTEKFEHKLTQNFGVGFGVMQAQYALTAEKLHTMAGEYQAVADEAKGAGLAVDYTAEVFRGMTLDGFTEDVKARVEALQNYQASLAAARDEMQALTADTSSWSGVTQGSMAAAETSYQKARETLGATLDQSRDLWRIYANGSKADADAMAQGIVTAYQNMASSGRAYIEALKGQWQELQQKIQEVKGEIEDLTKKTDDAIRDLSMKLLDDQGKWEANLARYNELYGEALKKANAGLYDEAKVLFEEAMAIADELAVEVTDGSGNVVSSLSDNTATAIGLITKASDAAKDALNRQASELAGNQAKVRGEIDKTADSLSRLQAQVKDFNQRAWEWGKSATMSLPTMGFNSGGSVPGSGSGDIIPAMLTPREFVQPVPAVNTYGVGFMEAVRQRKLPVAAVRALMSGRGYNLGGLVTRRPITVDVPRLRFSTGGQVPGAMPAQAMERIEVTLVVAGKRYPGIFEKSTGREFLSELEKAKHISIG